MPVHTVLREYATPQAKLWYLLAVATVLFAFPNMTTTVILLVVQACLWVAFSLDWHPIARILKRLTLFFVVIAVSYAFVSSGDSRTDTWTEFGVGPWTVTINVAGLSVAVMMCLRVFVLVAATAWVQESGRPGDFVSGLERLGVPRFVAASIDATVQLASGGGGGGRGGGRGGRSGRGRVATDDRGSAVNFTQLRQGNLALVTEMVERGLLRAEEFVVRANPGMKREEAKDLAIIVGMSTAIMGTKLLQILPGIPIAPGHKNVVIIPFLLLAARLTRKRLGGLWTGLTAGIVSALSGYGQYGVLEVAHFVVPGILADLLVPLVRSSHPAWLRFIEFAMIGGLLGIARFTANFLVILLAGSPRIAFVLYLPMLASQVFFGALSAFVSMAVLDLASRQALFPAGGDQVKAVATARDGEGQEAQVAKEEAANPDRRALHSPHRMD